MNCWPAVHRLDAANLYRLALEKGNAGDKFHAAAEAGIPFIKIAQAIGEGLNLPAISISKEEAHDHFGWFSHFAQLDISASSQITRKKLGWRPSREGLLEDLGQPHYF